MSARAYVYVNGGRGGVHSALFDDIPPHESGMVDVEEWAIEKALS